MSLRKYYEQTFPIDWIIRLITHNRAYSLSNVRFAFRWGEDVFKRHLIFQDEKSLRDALVQKVPSTVNVDFPENARPLVFDIDIHDYADIPRMFCVCQPKEVCKACWTQIMRPEMIKAKEFLCDFIGFKEVMFVFSGRKGFHIWVTDDEVWTWDSNARLNYVERMPVRCDQPITVSKGHLIKLPWTKHQKTGKVARVIEDIETWLP